MVEYTFEENTEMLIIYAKLDFMMEMHKASTKNPFHIAHSITYNFRQTSATAARHRYLQS